MSALEVKVYIYIKRGVFVSRGAGHLLMFASVLTYFPLWNCPTISLEKTLVEKKTLSEKANQNRNTHFWPQNIKAHPDPPRPFGWRLIWITSIEFEEKYLKICQRKLLVHGRYNILNITDTKKRRLVIIAGWGKTFYLYNSVTLSACWVSSWSAAKMIVEPDWKHCGDHNTQELHPSL